MENYKVLLVENRHLETERLLLRPVTLNDAQDMHAYASDEETTYYVFDRHKSITETKESIVSYFLEKPFGQEIRRYYPFFPFNAAMTRKDFIWNDYQFEKDNLVVLDFYGTNHDYRIWENPEKFAPERFSDWHTSPTDSVQMKLLAQGGGDYHKGHRCPGEWNTVRAMEVLADFLTNKLSYTVPEQDLSYSMVNVPTMPKSGMILENIDYIG